MKDSDLQLGEVKNSYGYGGTGKISDNCKFQSYGKMFGVGDVIGCYLDMNTDPVIMKFTVNGVDQGVAFRVAKSELSGEALFPHILTKNQDYTVNFGQLPGPMFPLLKGRKYLIKLTFLQFYYLGRLHPHWSAGHSGRPDPRSPSSSKSGGVRGPDDDWSAWGR